MTAVRTGGARPRTDARPAVTRRPSVTRPRAAFWPTFVLLIGAAYSLLPVLWLFTAATKSSGELFTTFSLWPSFTGGFAENFQALITTRDGAFWQWCLNSLIFAGGGALLGTAVSALAGYGLAKYRFRGKKLVFDFLLIGVLIPGVILAIPQYLLLSTIGVAGSYWSVLLPCMISPFSIYLCRIYASAVVSDEMLEAGRLDGAGEWRLFRSVAVYPMVPGLITVFLLQFVGIWNNFLLPYIMLSRSEMYPLTVGFFSLMSQGNDQPNTYNVVIMGCLVSIVPLIALFLFLQRYWRLDLVSGSLKG
ncbi:carbohydrate ABC transporter permease [Herbiconiux flava]|uniref:Multiple sugar transport system permease protein n=1 Tax=Herbiconiux flava TaxID=881268 RepID=A0A852SLU0_9MICO|nr:carbohydrate ABC transporter permease [Herbiconiux flava]NYD69419.1 multiple sugar transport system permease protein [Herbiconiux flava]GLK16164.1 sugar ABC transporter permease [Herbiconiux flava]